MKCIICCQVSTIFNTDLPVCKQFLLQQAQIQEEYEDKIDQQHQNDQKLWDDSSSIREIIPNKLY